MSSWSLVGRNLNDLFSFLPTCNNLIKLRNNNNFSKNKIQEWRGSSTKCNNDRKWGESDMRGFYHFGGYFPLHSKVFSLFQVFTFFQNLTFFIFNVFSSHRSSSHQAFSLLKSEPYFWIVLLSLIWTLCMNHCLNSDFMLHLSIVLITTWLKLLPLIIILTQIWCFFQHESFALRFEASSNTNLLHSDLKLWLTWVLLSLIWIFFDESYAIHWLGNFFLMFIFLLIFSCRFLSCSSFFSYSHVQHESSYLRFEVSSMNSKWFIDRGDFSLCLSFFSSSHVHFSFL